MNAERLLALYEQVAEAPDAVPRLRRFVLDLAVRGKLVPQDAGDEPASELLKRIAAERARLVKAGEIRNKSDLPPVEPPDQPHSIPSHWMWVRFGNIVDFSAGRTPSRNDTSFWNTGDYPWVSIADMADGQVVEVTKETVSEKARNVAFKSEPEPPGTMIMSFKLTIGKIARLGVPAFHNEAIIAIRPHLVELDPYLFKVLPDLARGGDTKGAIKGATLNRESISNILIPLPPLTEQRRIVAKVEELMALLDRLEAARGAAQATRDRLTAASLARLIAPDAAPAEFPANARFALATLPALTTRPDQIKPLRQTILNLAVRGKLVEQDPNDEPASELLKRIAAEKAASGKRQKDLPEIDADELGELPLNWSAVPLIALGEWAIGSGFPKNEQGETDGPYFFLKVSDMNLPENEKFITTANNTIDDEAAKRMRAAIHPPGTIIFPKIGGAIATNKRRILTRGSAIDNNCLGITFASDIDVEWAYLLLTTLDFTRYQAGTAVPALQQGTLAAIPVALPPLAEQHRIVAKVDALMTLCDRLEAALTTADITRARLLEALLHEALEPGAGDREAA